MSDTGDEKDPTPGGVRHDVKRVVVCLIVLGTLGGVALALLIARLTGML